MGTAKAVGDEVKVFSPVPLPAWPLNFQPRSAPCVQEQLQKELDEWDPQQSVI